MDLTRKESFTVKSRGHGLQVEHWGDGGETTDFSLSLKSTDWSMSRRFAAPKLAAEKLEGKGLKALEKRMSWK